MLALDLNSAGEAFLISRCAHGHEALLPTPWAARARARMTHHALMHSLCLWVGRELWIHGHVHLHLHLHHGRHLSHLAMAIQGVGVGYSEWALLGWVWRS